MSSRALHLTVDTDAARPTAWLSRVALTGTPVLLGHRMFADLVRELGDEPSAAQWLADLAAMMQKPVLVNLPTETGSTTVVISPPGWSQERLCGFVGGMAEDLQAAFGPATVRRMGSGR